MEFGKVSEKGGITIPKKIREQKGIHPNDHLYFAMMEDGRIVFDKINYKLLDSNANKNYQFDKTENEEKKKMEISEGGEERTQTEGGTKYEQLDESGRSPQKPHPTLYDYLISKTNHREQILRGHQINKEKK